MGATPQVTATLSEPKVRPGEYVELSISVKTDEEVETTPPQWKIPPGIESQGMQTRTAFESRLMPGPHGMQFEKKRTIEYVYQLKAAKEGNYKLGPFILSVQGQQMTLGGINLEVTMKAPAPSLSQRGRGFLPPGFDDESDEDSLLGQLLRRQQRMAPKNIPSRKLPINEKEAFFVIVEPDKTEAYEGEQVFASWYIYTRGDIHQFDRLKFPSLKGFWKEDVEPAPNPSFEKEMVNGVLFKRALLASYALFPIKAGTSIIDEYKVRATVSLPSNQGYLGQFGYGQPYTYTRTSKPVKVLIKPLPLEGKPASFSGAVGNFKIEAHVDNQTIVQGQPFSLKLRYDGDGNAKLIELPKIEWPEQFELYDSKSESRFFQSGKSYKEFTLLVIPKESGVQKLPPFELSYFDPSSGTYKLTQTQEIALQVTPGKVSDGNPSVRMKLDEDKTKEVVPFLPLPEAPRGYSSWHWLSGISMFYAWVSLYGVLFFIFIFGHWIWLKRLYSRRNLFDELRDRKQKCEKLIQKDNITVAAAEVINAIYYLLSRLVDEGEFSKDLSTLLEQLPPSIREAVADAIRKELEVLQTVAFAPEDAWKNLTQKDKFRQHSSRAFEMLERTLQLSEEGA